MYNIEKFDVLGFSTDPSTRPYQSIGTSTCTSTFEAATFRRSRTPPWRGAVLGSRDTDASKTPLFRIQL